MATPSEAQLLPFMDDPIAFAIERECHSFLCDACEGSEMFIDIERLRCLMSNQEQQDIAIHRPE